MHMNWIEILNTPHSLFPNTNTRCYNRRWCHKSDNAAFLSGAFMKDCICQVRRRPKGFFFSCSYRSFWGERKILARTFMTPHAGQRQPSVLSRECHTLKQPGGTVHIWLSMSAESEMRCLLEEACAKIFVEILTGQMIFLKFLSNSPSDSTNRPDVSEDGQPDQNYPTRED